MLFARLFPLLLFVGAALARSDPKRTMCKGVSFVPSVCNNGPVAGTFAGDDGPAGNPGRTGMIGAIGLQGNNAASCLRANLHHYHEDHCTFRKTLTAFLTTRTEIRWMDAIMHVLYGHDIVELTKEELIKLVTSQTSKIIDDHTAIHVLDATVNKLRQELATIGRTTEIKLAGVVKENTHKATEIQRLTLQITTLHKQVESIKTKDATIDKLNQQVVDLNKKLGISARSVQELTLLQNNVKKLQEKLKSQSMALTLEISGLQASLKKKDIKSLELKKLITDLKKQVQVQIDAAKSLATENERLKTKMTEAADKCHKTSAAHDVAMRVLQAQLDQMKTKCKNLKTHTATIAKLQEQLQRLTAQAGSHTPSGSFKSYNFPNYGIGIKHNNQAWIVKDNIGQFKLVSPGLTGQAGTVSFESLDKPGYFLRHRDFFMWLERKEETDLFKNDGTFRPRENLFFNGFTVFESVNFPNFYINHQNFRLKITKDDHTKMMRENASFQFKESSGSHTLSGSFKSHNFPNYGIGIKHNNQAWIVKDNIGQFKLVSPGLTGQAGTVSFESLDKPGYFLRHRDFFMWLERKEETDLFKNDGTFRPRENLFFNGFTVFESVNFPNFYINHQNFRLKITKDDHTKMMQENASFQFTPNHVTSTSFHQLIAGRSIATKITHQIESKTVCEHQTAELICPQGTVIKVTDNLYGRQNRRICNNASKRSLKIPRGGCAASNSLQKAQELCDGHQTCQLPASNKVFGDPCSGTYKYMQVKWQCAEIGGRSVSMLPHHLLNKISSNVNHASSSSSHHSSGTTTHHISSSHPMTESELQKLLAKKIAGLSKQKRRPRRKKKQRLD